MKKTSLIALLLALILSLTSCIITLPPPNEGNSDSPAGDNGGASNDNDTQTDGSDIKTDPEEWGDSSALAGTTVHTTVIKDTPTDIRSLVSDKLDTNGAVWQSECEGIAAVDNGIVTGVKCGRTDITVTDTLGEVCVVTVTVEFLLSTNNGYDFSTKTDTTVYEVDSEYEANRLIDLAIASHIAELTLDFSSFGSSYVAYRDFDIETEFGNHISIIRKYYESQPHTLYIELKYEKSSATGYVNKTPENTYHSLANGNMIIRMDRLNESEHKRADDFEGFSINTNNNGSFKVYNSEELWWALEQNYKPEFAFSNSKAELFYERAKMILRDIITEDMDDLDKVIAISEYLTDAVAYDYDSFYNIGRDEDDTVTNVCYYLEGVFERGVAVCDGKSKAFVLLCRIEGIECVRDFGHDPLGGAGHAWNYVKLGGEWYMVDTTGTDNSSSISAGIGEYYGKNVELMVYTPLLTSVFYHVGTYDYSGVFDQITDISPDASLTDEVFKNKIYGTQYDFYMNTSLELKNVAMLLLSTELCDEAALSFRTPLDSNSVFDAVEAAVSASGSPADYNLFQFGDGTDAIYVLLFKGM